MLKKLLQRTHSEEALIGSTVSSTFAGISKLPAYTYPANGGNVRPIEGNPISTPATSSQTGSTTAPSSTWNPTS